MVLQFVCCGLPSQSASPSYHRPTLASRQIAPGVANNGGLSYQGLQFVNVPKCLNWLIKEPSLSKRSVLRASNSGKGDGLEFHGDHRSSVPVTSYYEVEPFRGKPGSVSFHGLTHQSIEEGKLESAPFQKDKGSLFWILAPTAFISSLVLPQFFLNYIIEGFFQNLILVEIATSLSFETLFYIGLAIFLLVADHVQRPYLDYSAKRWSLITGLKGYLYSAFLTMGLKVIVPLFLLYVTWPVLGLAAIVAVAPFLVSCAVQFAFETYLDKRESSCWPLVPIIFEVYRLYQLTKSAHFIEKLMFSMRGLRKSPELMERSGAMFALIVTFQLLGVVCIWSLMTFLLRLFPSRPVAEKY